MLVLSILHLVYIALSLIYLAIVVQELQLVQVVVLISLLLQTVLVQQLAAAYDFGNGFTLAGGLSGAGGDSDGLFTKDSKDVFGVQAAYNTDAYGVSVSYASTDLTTTTESTFWGVNGFYAFEGSGLPSISVGYESEDPETTATEEGFFVGLTWAEVGPGSVSLGVSSNENFTSAQTETYTYEAAYTYPINDGMTITPGVFIKEVDSADDETGLIVKTSFSF